MRRTGIGSSRTSWPATETVPEPGVSSVASTRSVVVLPAPLGPKMLRKPPRSRPKERPFSTSRRPNVLRRPSTSISSGTAASVRPTRRPRPSSASASAATASRASCSWRRPLGHSETAAPTQSRIEPIHTKRMSGKTTMRRAMVLRGAVERRVGDHEQVLLPAAEDDGAHGRAGHGIDVGVRLERRRPACRRASRRRSRWSASTFCGPVPSCMPLYVSV